MPKNPRGYLQKPTDPINRRFGEMVLEKRMTRHWSQYDLAAEADMNPSSIGYLELGGGISLAHAVKLAYALNLDLNELLDPGLAERMENARK